MSKQHEEINTINGFDMNESTNMLIDILTLILCLSILSLFFTLSMYIIKLSRSRIQQENKRKAHDLIIAKEKKEQELSIEKKTREEAQRIVAEKIKVSEAKLERINILLIEAIRPIADEKPCPKCNEVDVLIMELSPSARSVTVRCIYCRKDYRIKLDPNNPNEIISLFRSFEDEAQNLNNIKESGRVNDISDTDSELFDYYITPVDNTPKPNWTIAIPKNQPGKREVIPKHIKRAIWNRDAGQCVNCGSRMELQYDHIIPVSKGGSSTIENLQILCKTCNLRKHASIE